MTLHLGPINRGDAPISPPHTTPTAMTATLITEPGGDVGPESQVQIFIWPLLCQGGREKNSESRQMESLVKWVVQQSLKQWGTLLFLCCLDQNKKVDVSNNCPKKCMYSTVLMTWAILIKCYLFH